MTDEICPDLPILVTHFDMLFVYNGSHSYSHIVLPKKSVSLKINVKKKSKMVENSCFEAISKSFQISFPLEDGRY